MKKKIETICDKRVEELMERRQELRENYIEQESPQQLGTSLMIKRLNDRIEEAQIIKGLLLKGNV